MKNALASFSVQLYLLQRPKIVNTLLKILLPHIVEMKVEYLFRRKDGYSIDCATTADLPIPPESQ